MRLIFTEFMLKPISTQSIRLILSKFFDFDFASLLVSCLYILDSFLQLLNDCLSLVFFLFLNVLCFFQLFVIFLLESIKQILEHSFLLSHLLTFALG